MSESYQCFGGVMTVQEMLMDKRCHPEVTYDVIRKRLSRTGPLSIPEIALTTPVIKGAQPGDTKARTRERKRKSVERYKMFILCQKVRDRYNAGVERSEIKDRFDITESFLQKVISGQYGYNWAWDLCRVGEVPEHFKDLKHECEYIEGATLGLDKFKVEDL